MPPQLLTLRLTIQGSKSLCDFLLIPSCQRSTLRTGTRPIHSEPASHSHDPLNPHRLRNPKSFCDLELRPHVYPTGSPPDRQPDRKEFFKNSSQGWDPRLSVLESRSTGCGDREIRTPDPLLAKQMLYQLSYVPVANHFPACAPTWTRTKDLRLIRAAL